MAEIVEDVTVAVYRFPTPEPEADGTLTWDATVAVTVQVSAAGVSGLGWTYSSPAAATVIREHLKSVVVGRDAAAVAGAAEAMRVACRNFGTKGLVMQAISAVDIALWDLKARLLQTPLVALLGATAAPTPVYGSGGFTSLSDQELASQVEGWLEAGCTAMKIKIGENWGSCEARDLQRVDMLRRLAGDGVAPMVDANGGYRRAQARRIGRQLDERGVVWFEEPVSSDDPAGLAAVAAAVECDVAAGEYSSDSYDTERLAPAVDCVQLDVTRCGGFTGWLAGAAVAAAHNRDVSGHCAPSLHAVIAPAVPYCRHIEWFADHARLERLLLEPCPVVSGGRIHPPPGPGHGMSLAGSAAPYRVDGG